MHHTCAVLYTTPLSLRTHPSGNSQRSNGCTHVSINCSGSPNVTSLIVRQCSTDIIQTFLGHAKIFQVFVKFNQFHLIFPCRSENFFMRVNVYPTSLNELKQNHKHQKILAQMAFATHFAFVKRKNSKNFKRKENFFILEIFTKKSRC